MFREPTFHLHLPAHNRHHAADAPDAQPPEQPTRAEQERCTRTAPVCLLSGGMRYPRGSQVSFNVRRK